MPELNSFKVVIRCADYAASLRFYATVLGFEPIDEWEEKGGRGCILALSRSRGEGYVEIYEMHPDSARYQPAFSTPLQNDKIDLQLRTETLDEWADALSDTWPFEGPEELPWGQRWIKLRDPDHLLIAIYEGQI